MTIETPKPPAFFPDSDRHFFLVVDYLGRVGDQVTGNGGPLPLAEYTQTTPEDTRPTASLDTGSIIYASDTEKIQFSDGTDWVSVSTSDPDPDPDVKSVFYDLDDTSTVTSSTGSSVLTFHASGHTAEPNDYVYFTGLDGIIGTSLFDLTTLNGKWWKVLSPVVDLTSFDIDVVTIIEGTFTVAEDDAQYQLNVPGPATSASGTANKKGSVTIGTTKFYFDRQSVVATGDDITTVDLALEFSEIWSVVCCQSEDTGNDRNVIALVKDSTKVDLINKGDGNREITFHCIGLAAA